MPSWKRHNKMPLVRGKRRAVHVGRFLIYDLLHSAFSIITSLFSAANTLPSTSITDHSLVKFYANSISLNKLPGTNKTIIMLSLKDDIKFIIMKSSHYFFVINYHLCRFHL